MGKNHYAGAGNLHGWASTACGVSIMMHGDEYRTENAKPIKATYRDWSGVTCAACLRNPHSPRGRIGLTALPVNDRGASDV